jgi:hypothetical protein
MNYEGMPLKLKKATRGGNPRWSASGLPERLRTKEKWESHPLRNLDQLSCLCFSPIFPVKVEAVAPVKQRHFE